MRIVVEMIMPKRSPTFAISMPKGARLLTIRNLFGVPALYFEINPELEIEMRYFRIAQNGELISDPKLMYLDTVVLQDGREALHFFEDLDGKKKPKVNIDTLSAQEWDKKLDVMLEKRKKEKSGKKPKSTDTGGTADA